MKVLVFIGAFLLGLPMAQAVVCGKIVSMRGQVEILRVKEGTAKGGELVRNVVKGKKRLKLMCDDIVLTQKASRAKLRFKNKAVMALGPFSRVEVLEFVKKTSGSGGPSLLQLTYGKVRTLIKKQKAGGKSKGARLKVKTPSAVVGVRGTDFFVSYEPNTQVTGQATIEGSVEVEQVGTGQKAIVNQGKQVTVEAVRPPAPPVTQKSDSSEQGTGMAKDVAKPPPMVVKPLVVVDLVPEVKEEIRQTSVIAKNDTEFVSPEAVEVLGPPEMWKPPADEVPMDLKDLKEEF